MRIFALTLALGISLVLAGCLPPHHHHGRHHGHRYEEPKYHKDKKYRPHPSERHDKYKPVHRPDDRKPPKKPPHGHGRS